MARTFISELKDRDPVDSVFLAKRKKLENFRNKPGQYLALTLMDRTGELEARMWEGGPAIAATFGDGEPVRVKGVAEVFNDRLQLRLSLVVPVPLESVDLADFLPACPRPTEEMLAELTDAIASVTEPHLQALLQRVFTPELKTALARAPGSINVHHVYLGGLLEHTLNVARLLEEVCRLYPGLDRDLLIAGCLLHDLGKLQEYRYDTVLDYSPHGRLLGHVVIGASLLHRALEEAPDFPGELGARLWHLVISHHGERVYGAPVVPLTAEAAALHHAENLEAHVNQFLGKIEDARQRNPAGAWAGWDNLLQRSLYVGIPEEEAP